MLEAGRRSEDHSLLLTSDGLNYSPAVGVNMARVLNWSRVQRHNAFDRWQSRLEDSECVGQAEGIKTLQPPPDISLLR